jgi:metal-sulfur cluster biosynthetic enzyme
LTTIKPADPGPADHAGMDSHDALATDRRIAMQALTQVVDPEICENIVDLGLVERLHVEPARIELVLVLTSPTCPMGDAIVDDAMQALQQAFPGREVEVLETQGVDWSPQRMSAAARQRLGWDDAQG